MEELRELRRLLPLEAEDGESRIDFSARNEFSKPKYYTLVFVFDGIRVLLGMKKRGFGEGKWNGFGGKCEPNEGIEDCAKRELFEEVGIVCKSLKKVGEHYYVFPPPLDRFVVVSYIVTEWAGEPVETEEMTPRWFHKNEVPFADMLSDTEAWLPFCLEEKKYVAVAHCNEDGKLNYLKIFNE